MDTSTFRWILVIAGTVVLAGLYFFGVRDKKRKPRASRKRVHAQRVRHERALGSDQGGESPNENEDDSMQTELAIGESTENGSRIEPHFESMRDDKPKTPEVPLPDKIVTLFLQAHHDHVITGVDLLDASLKSGLVFGSHDIFHRINEEDVEPIFSMANLTKPGSFDKTSWNTMEILPEKWTVVLYITDICTIPRRWC